MKTRPKREKRDCLRCELAKAALPQAISRAAGDTNVELGINAAAIAAAAADRLVDLLERYDLAEAPDDE